MEETSRNARRPAIEEIATANKQEDPAPGTKKKRLSEVSSLIRAAESLDWRPTSPGDLTPTLNFAQKYLSVQDRKGIGRALRANPAQFAFEQHRGKRNIILKARQMGVTTWVAARFFLKTIMRPNVLTVQVAQTQEAAQSIFRMVQRFWEYLPDEIREDQGRRSIANVGAMRFPELDSEFRVLSASDANAGRGLTMQNLHCSEVARWPGNASETLAGLRAALVPGGELIIESTPNGACGCFYEEWNKAVDPIQQQFGRHDDKDDRLIRHFFPWWMEPAYVAAPAVNLTVDEQRLVRMHGLSPRQIGFRRGLEESYRGLRSQEFAEDAETCFRATGECCFDIEAIDNRLCELTRPIEIKRGGALQIYLPPQAGKQYLVAVDSAGGGDTGDFAAIQVIEIKTGLQCAELQQRIRPGELAEVSAQLAREYGEAILAVESNNHGNTVLAFLDAAEFYKNLYWQGRQKGWLTTAASKSTMVGHMGALLAESPELFYSRRLLAECRTFVSFAGGKTGAANGSHDDCFMAMAVAQCVRAELLTGKAGFPASRF